MISDIHEALIKCQFKGWLKYTEPTAITFHETVEIDEYSTVTIGTWGGYLVQIMPMLFNFRLVLTPERSRMVVAYGWCYDKGPAAVLAALVWDPETQGEPPGFKKRVGPPRLAGERADDVITDAESVLAESVLALLDTLKAEDHDHDR